MQVSAGCSGDMLAGCARRARWSGRALRLGQDPGAGRRGEEECLWYEQADATAAEESSSKEHFAHEYLD